MDIEAIERSDIRRKQVRVAALFVLALLLAMLFAYWMGVFALGPSRHFWVNYDFAGGIDRGSPVRLAGVKVGRVSDIQFSKTGADSRLKVKIELSHRALGEITEDSAFYVNLAGIIGERYIEIVPGHGPIAKAGQEFRGVDPPRVDQLFSQGYGIFGDLRALLQENKADLKDMLSSLVALSKNLNKLFDQATPEQRKKLNNFLDNISVMSTDLRKLVADGNSAEARRTLQHVANVMARLNQVEGDDIRRLMMEDGIRVRLSSKEVPHKGEKKEP